MSTHHLGEPASVEHSTDNPIPLVDTVWHEEDESIADRPKTMLSRLQSSGCCQDRAPNGPPDKPFADQSAQTNPTLHLTDTKPQPNRSSDGTLGKVPTLHHGQ